MIYKVKKNIELHNRRGYFQIFQKHNHEKEFKQIDEFHNLITNICLEAEARIFMTVASNPNIQIRYCALGDDNTAVTASDTVLGNEVGRVFKGSQTYSATGEVTTDFYFTDSDASGEDIQEIGIFAGNTATETTDSGKLISHVLWNYGVKASTIEFLVRRIDTIS